MISLFLAVPLFTYGSDLIEAGAPEKGAQFLHSLLTADISQEMQQRVLYNLGVAALDRNNPLEALSFFQSANADAGPLKPLLERGVALALAQKPPSNFTPFSTVPSPLTLDKALRELHLILANLASLSYENGEKTDEYRQIKNQLGLIIAQKKDWWSSVIKRQQELLPKGCSLKHFEAIADNLAEGTLLLEKAFRGFKQGAKPYAALYPPLKSAIDLLAKADADLQVDIGGKAPEIKTTETERFELLSEIFRKDHSPPPPAPKGALW